MRVRFARYQRRSVRFEQSGVACLILSPSIDNNGRTSSACLVVPANNVTPRPGPQAPGPLQPARAPGKRRGEPTKRPPYPR